MCVAGHLPVFHPYDVLFAVVFLMPALSHSPPPQLRSRLAREALERDGMSPLVVRTHGSPSSRRREGPVTIGSPFSPPPSSLPPVPEAEVPHVLGDHHAGMA